MLDAAIRRIPLPLFSRFRAAVHERPRGDFRRLVATAVLRRAAVAHKGRLAVRVTEIRPVDRPELRFLSVDSMVMDAVYWFGVRGYEGTVARVWVALCANAASVLEIGGNVGLFTVLGAAAGTGHYTVVEPIPVNAETLRGNLRLNGLDRVDVRQAAVVPGAEARDVVLSVPSEGRDQPVGAHMIEGVEVDARASAGTVVVAGLPMLGLVAGRDVIKIDAEGIEAALLTDVRAHLVAHRPTLLIEVLPEARALGALLAALATEVGYTIHVLPEWGSDDTVVVDAAGFDSAVPGRHNAKDVVLHMGALPG